jgi:UDPglucose--hexose-1-phosphate uridylyltransferase
VIRYNALTGEPVLFAPGRASRFEATTRCPFCPGHEDDTPPELARIGDPWRVRAFPNKYPPIEGAEVIVPASHDDADSEEFLQLCAARIDAHRDAAYVALFRNEGARAGATIEHAHAQLVPLPFVPPRIARERITSPCPLCTVPGTIIRSTESFHWITPHASAFAYQQWIVPRQHTPFASSPELASLLANATRATRTVTPAFNWMLMDLEHFYIDLVPRTAMIAGLELGTGTFVEIVDPKRAAERLGRIRSD